MPPPVTVILPVLDEADHIDACLESLTTQEYDGELTIVAAEGGSVDGTPQRLAAWQRRWPGLTVVDNPERVQSAGLNLAAAAAPGEILVRADAHTAYASDYVRRSVEVLLGSGAVAVGGPMRPEGRGAFGRAVAIAMQSKLATGPGKFHHEAEAGPVDTVYLGAFRRADFARLGGFRTFPSGSGEDADLYHRWRRQGGTVLLDPSIRSTYRPRETPAALARQHLRYGHVKGELLYVNGTWPSWRPLAPLVLVVGLAATALLAVVTPWWWPFAALLALWLAALLVVAVPAGRLAPAVLLAAAIMHLAYGAGLVWGLLRGPGVRRKVGSPGAGVGGVVPAVDGAAQQPHRHPEGGDQGDQGVADQVAGRDAVAGEERDRDQ